VAQAIIERLGWVQALKSITIDNGKEFALHQLIAKVLSTEVYFAHPYSS
jgi:IS30 family transposase